MKKLLAEEDDTSAKGKKPAEGPDIKELHAKIGQLVEEHLLKSIGQHSPVKIAA